MERQKGYIYRMTSDYFFALEVTFPKLVVSMIKEEAAVWAIRDRIATNVEKGILPDMKDIRNLSKLQAKLLAHKKEYYYLKKLGVRNPFRKKEVMDYLNISAGLRDKVVDIEIIDEKE